MEFNGYVTSNSRIVIKDKWKCLWSILRYYTRICLEVQRKTTINIVHNGEHQGCDMNPKPLECKTEMPPARKLHSKKDRAGSWILYSYHKKTLMIYATLMWNWIQFTRYSHFLITAITLLNIVSISRCLPKQQLHVHLAISTGHFCKFVHNEDCKFGQFL